MLLRTPLRSGLFALTLLCIACQSRPQPAGGGEGSNAEGAAQPPASADSIAPPPRDRTALPEYSVARVSEGSIAIDGAAVGAEWAAAAWSDAFVAPGNGAYVADSGVNARFKAAWDSRALFMLVEVLDSGASSPNARDAVDPHIWENASGIELMLQPGNHGDNEEYFEVQVDTAGAVWDTRFDDYNQPIIGEGEARQFGHQVWSAALERAVVVATDRYTVELALPWSTLTGVRSPSPPPEGAVWRANVYSFRDGQRQALAWSPIMGEGNFHKATRFGLWRFTATGAPPVGVR